LLHNDNYYWLQSELTDDKKRHWLARWWSIHIQ